MHVHTTVVCPLAWLNTSDPRIEEKMRHAQRTLVFRHLWHGVHLYLRTPGHFSWHQQVYLKLPDHYNDMHFEILNKDSIWLKRIKCKPQPIHPPSNDDSHGMTSQWHINGTLAHDKFQFVCRRVKAWPLVKGLTA